MTEFEGLGVGDVNGGTNGTDDDMNDLFRSFLVDGDDLLNVASNNNGNSNGNNHPAANGQAGSASADLPPPAGFLLRVGSGGGGRMGAGGGGHDGVEGGMGGPPARRRANTSPDSEDVVNTQVCFLFAR